MKNKVVTWLKQAALKVASVFVRLIMAMQISKFFLSRWIAAPFIVVLFFLFKDDTYALIFYAKTHVAQKKKTKKRQYNTFRFKFFVLKALAGDRSQSIDKYVKLLETIRVATETQYKLANRFVGSGRLDLAYVTYNQLLLEGNALSAEKRLLCYRGMGMVCFLSGKNSEASHYWGLAGKWRELLFGSSIPRNYRILGGSWFAAVGHVAMLDYYLKYQQLYVKEKRRIVAIRAAEIGCTTELMEKFVSLGITILEEGELEADYDQWALENNAVSWAQLSSDSRLVMTDDFWEHVFPDGQVLSYTHMASRIQKEWEKQRRRPLLSVLPAERQRLNYFLCLLGIPEKAWYVCLHVREPGFHKGWNSKYPAMRDANIDDYYDAIQTIVDAGGWVIRMGDPSMKPLKKMPHVIDYAHSPIKSSFADMLLSATCRFFLGTNSGLATIPAIYGVPCALTNWIPIGWPLWPSQDLMIPKLFREKSSGRLLTFIEIFERTLIYLQNWADLPDDLELVDNSSEDIRALTIEMLSGHLSGADREIQQMYEKLVEKHGGFMGSKLSRSFVERHPEVFYKKIERANINQELEVMKL